jgi:hypothetical protein
VAGNGGKVKEDISSKRPRRCSVRRNCFLIAFLYQGGLDRGEWTTQAAASNALRVSQAELSMALRLKSLPAELVRMFGDPAGVSSHTVRVIREVIARDGLETVRERIRQHAAAGRELPTKAVLALVKGRMSDATKALASSGTDENRIVTRSEDLPRYISDRYHLGIINGEWTSYSGCSRALGISRRNISDAVSIGELPDSVRCLFKESDLTFAVGRRVLAIEKELGTEKLQARAQNISYMAREQTAEQVLREFNWHNVQPGELSRVRIKKGRGARRLIIECDHAEFLFLYRREMEAALNKVVSELAVKLEGERIRAIVGPLEVEELRRSIDRNR